MKHAQGVRGGTVVTSLLVALAACSSRKAAEERLTREGFTEVRLSEDGDGFSFTARKSGALCTGTITISSGPFSSSESLNQACVTPSRREAGRADAGVDPGSSSQRLTTADAPPGPEAPEAGGTVSIRGHAIDNAACTTALMTPEASRSLPPGAASEFSDSFAGAMSADASRTSRSGLEAWVTTLTAPPGRRFVVVPWTADTPRWAVRCVVDPPTLGGADFASARPGARAPSGRFVVEATLTRSAARRVRRLASSRGELLFLTGTGEFAAAADASSLARAGVQPLAFDAMPGRFEDGPEVTPSETTRD